MVGRTAAELAATKLRDGGGEGMPTLDEVLDVFAGSAIELHIEIKTDAIGKLYPGSERRLVERARAARAGRTRAMLTCFAPEVAGDVREIAPRQRVLASLDQRSADTMGGLAPALDRFAAIEGCLVAVEKGLLS